MFFGLQLDILVVLNYLACLIGFFHQRRFLEVIESESVFIPVMDHLCHAVHG